MITGTLKVTPQKLESTATEFANESTKIRNLTQQMINKVTSMNNIWQGDAQQAYVNKFKSLDGDMAQIVLLIKEHVDDLKAMAANYKQAESDNTNTASGLVSDFISG